jgi:hypothetical protein
MPMITADFHAHIKALGAQERVFLCCLASGTDWKEAGVTLKTVAGLGTKWAAPNKPHHVPPLVTLGKTSS